MPEQMEECGNRRGSGVGHSRARSPSQLENKKRAGSAKYYDIATALMGKGKTVDLEELFVTAARDGDYERIEDFLLRSGKDHMISIDVKDKRTGNTPLIWAAKRGHTKIVQLLLKHGADITLRNYDCHTAVEVASPAIKTILLDSVERSTESSHRLLLQAAWQGNITVLRKLLNENRVRDINCQNGDGLTPLLLATRDIQMFERLCTQLNKPYNPAECVEELLKHRADVQACDEGGKTGLHHASQSKASLAQSVVQTLVTGCSNLDIPDKRLFAPIHCASQIGNVECIEALIEGGSCVNHKGFAGTTPLHITAYNDHEKAACCLLRHGADITLTDDRGLTAVDLARGRKMKNTLKEAWSEATMNRTQTSLGPLRTQSREDLRNAVEDFNKKKKGGEVIYDSMPANPFSNMKSNSKAHKAVTRHLSLKEKANLAEEVMMKDIENGSFTPGPYVKDGAVRRLGMTRNQRPSPLPKNKGFDRLPAISPDRLSADRRSESPAFSRNSRMRRSLDESRLSSSRGSWSKSGNFPKDSKKLSPLSTNESALQRIPPVEHSQSGQLSGRQPPASPTFGMRKSYQHHKRAGSDSMASPNFGDVAASCDPYLLQRGRSVSLSSKPLCESDDFSDACANSPRLTPLQRAPMEREISCISLQNEGMSSRSNTTSVVLDLDRMGLLNKCQTPLQNTPLYPTSSKVLPSTPTILGQKSYSCLESRMTDHPDSEHSSKDSSPRSDEEVSSKKKEVRLAFENTYSPLRSRSILKEEFILEESRPKDLMIQSSASDDSAGSKDRNSVSSGEMSPMEINKPVAKQPQKVRNSKSTVPNDKNGKYTVVSVNAQSRLKANLRTVKSVKENAAVVSVKSTSNSVPNKSDMSDKQKDKITLHSQSIGVNTVLPSDKGNNAKSSTSQGSNVKSSNKSNKDSSSKATTINGAATPTPFDSSMTVVSTKLVSNVKEEIRRAKEQTTSNSRENSGENIQNNAKDNSNVVKSMNPGNNNVASNSVSGSVTNKTTGQKVTSAVPSYLQPTHSSSKRQTPQEVKSQSQVRNSGSETARKSSFTNSVYSRLSQPKSIAKETSSAQGQRTVSSSVNNSTLSKQKTNVTSNNDTSKPSEVKKTENVTQPQTTVIKKSQSDSSIAKETAKTVSNSAVKSSGKTRSVSEDLSSSKQQEKVPQGHSSKPNVKSNSMTTINETKKTGNSSALKSQSDTDVIEQKLQQNSLVPESPRKNGKIQYKPASAGKAPLVEIVPNGTPRVKSKCIDNEVVMPIQTPVIVNPFEDMVSYQTDLDNMNNAKINEKGVSATAYGYVVSKPALERSKTTASTKSSNTSKSKRPPSKEPKPSSAGANKQGGRRKGAKSKDSKQSDEGASRPKSGKKRVKSGKKRKKNGPDVLLGKQAAQADVALISGIGWHVATSCMDKSDVTVVKTVGSDSSDSSDEENDLDLPTPRFSNINQLQVPNAVGDPSSNQSTPRFQEVKAVEKEGRELPVMSNDGYPPMNLDMTQISLPTAFDLSHMLARENSQASLPSDFSSIVNNATVDMYQNSMYDQPTSEQERVAAEIHQQILLGKLTPIPESPSLRSNAMIHKTMEAIEKFDKNVQEETLNKMLGIAHGEVVDNTPRNDHTHKNGARNSSSNTSRSLNDSARNRQQGSASISYSAKNVRAGEKTLSSASSKDHTSAHSVRSTRYDNKKSAGGRSEKYSGSISSSRKGSSSRQDKVTVKDPETVKQMVPSAAKASDIDVKIQDNVQFKSPSVPRLENLEAVGEDSDDSWGDDFEKRKPKQKFEPVSTRRERVFSETKSDDKDEEYIDEAIEEIMSNTLRSNSSTLKSMKSSKSMKSLSSTYSEADKHLLMKLSSQKNSPFYPRQSSSTQDRVRQSGSLEDLSAQHPTNPNLLKVFHAEKYQIGQKVKALMDAGADKSKVKAMLDVDSEAKQIAKIMNSFKHMELYAGPASVKTPGKDNSHVIMKPEVSSADPFIGRKPPLARPNSAGAGKVRSAGRFTEIREKKLLKKEKDKTPRQSGQFRDEKLIRKSSDSQNLRGSTYISTDTAEQEIANVMRSSTPDIESVGDPLSRSGSACTTISSQSSIDETIQWKKGNVLGKGAFGTVWCGLTNEGQLIAVKQIELNTVDKDKAKREYEKVQEEVELLKTIDHKNIVGYLGTSLEENIVSIFMQFVPGGSIASILARFGALDEAVFRRYTRQILEGVEYLHANDVIHRDIKGGNVMLMPNGIIKLIDFGCAKRLCINLSMGQSQILKSMKGTPYWMAPEVVNETGHGKKSDIWSVGCTIFEMATRKPPWADMNPMAAIFAIGSNNKPVPQLPSKFSNDAVCFVDKCLTRDQNKRLSATQLLQHMFISKRKGSKSSDKGALVKKEVTGM